MAFQDLNPPSQILEQLLCFFDLLVNLFAPCILAFGPFIAGHQLAGVLLQVHPLVVQAGVQAAEAILYARIEVFDSALRCVYGAAYGSQMGLMALR